MYPYKGCPTCHTPTVINASECPACGHTFRTRFLNCANTQAVGAVPHGNTVKWGVMVVSGIAGSAASLWLILTGTSDYLAALVCGSVCAGIAVIGVQNLLRH